MNIISSNQHLLNITGFLAVLLLTGCGAEPQQSVLRSAEEYYRQGLQFKKQGRIELSRQQLKKAIESDHNGMVTSMAEFLMDTQLPKKEVSQEAEQRNAIGFNQLAKKDIPAAKKTFEDLTRDFPDFEWPYLNLAMIYLKEDKTPEATKLLYKAVEINPRYLKALSLLAKVKQAAGDSREAEDLRKKIHELQLKNPDYSGD